VLTERLSELSVFMPAYNEELNVGASVEECLRELPALAEKFEIIVVDDGSRDRTATIVRELAQRDERVRLVQHNRNRGFGAACRSGIAASRYQFIFYTDIDGQFRIRDLGRLIPLIADADLVSAYRLHRQDPPFRQVYAFCYNALLKLLFGLPFRDVDASFKLYRREIFNQFQIESETGFSDAETLLKARIFGLRVRQVGVPHYARRAGTVSFQAAQGGLFSGLVRFRAIKELWDDLWRFRRRAQSGYYWKLRHRHAKIAF
jgi:glycosyltransferase involved in cell wall biosynthesis